MVFKAEEAEIIIILFTKIQYQMLILFELDIEICNDVGYGVWS